MIFRRKITDELLKWKNECNGKYALMIEGARRVGKTTVVREFAKKNYRSHLFIDFSSVKMSTLKIFNEGIGNNPDSFFMQLQLSEDTTLYERDSLIVFDEVQLYPKARQMIKHLVADGRYDYIETGSLISIKKNVEKILIPSEELHIQMHPMDFEEYLWAFGDESTVPILRKMFEERKPLGNSLHNKIMTKYREYMIVGGMPQVVSEFVDGKDLEAADRAKRSILDLYHEDIEKFSGYAAIRSKMMFDAIPALLSRNNKRFSPGKIKKGSRVRDYSEAVVWLRESKIINECFDCTDPSAALMLSIDDLDFKLYLIDTGLLISESFRTGLTTPNDLYKSLMFDKLSVNKGMFFENMVAQELVMNGHRLIYHQFSADDTNETYEVDFILINGKKIVPLEAKSQSSKRHVSLDRFIYKYRGVSEAFVIHTKDLRTEGNLTYIPIYMTMFL